MTNILDALVVGAGPTGLTMAGELARRGLAVRLVDRALEPPPDHSRALVVQARTMEIFEQMGIAEAERARSLSVEALNLILPSGRRARLPLAGLQVSGVPFPGMLVVQQFDTETVLASRLPALGVTPERGVELVSYTQDESGVAVTLRRGDGGVEQVRAAWLLGCDGARSAVRKGADISFDGDTYDDQCLLGDVVIDWELPDGELYISPGRRGIVAAFPVPGEHRFRVILILPEARQEKPAELTLGEFQETLRSMLPVPFQIRKAIVLTRYRLHHRVATRLREGRAFLCGDAAHIHSPVGGQGMNTGIQDAYNLAWKIAAVQRGQMPVWVLDTYQAERLPIARRLVNVTDRAFGLVAGHGAAGRLLRATAPQLAARALGLPSVQRRIGGFASQLRIRYRNSSLSLQLGVGPGQGPHPGERAPDGTLRDASGAQVRVFELMRHPAHTLLLFAGTSAAGAAPAQVRGLAERLRRSEVEAIMKVVVIGTGADGAMECSDPGGSVHAIYGARAPSAVLLRPDGYIGLRCDPLREDALVSALARRFTAGAFKV